MRTRFVSTFKKALILPVVVAGSLKVCGIAAEDAATVVAVVHVEVKPGPTVSAAAVSTLHQGGHCRTLPHSCVGVARLLQHQSISLSRLCDIPQFTNKKHATATVTRHVQLFQNGKQVFLVSALDVTQDKFYLVYRYILYRSVKKAVLTLPRIVSLVTLAQHQPPPPPPSTSSHNTTLQNGVPLLNKHNNEC